VYDDKHIKYLNQIMRRSTGVKNYIISANKMVLLKFTHLHITQKIMV